MKSFKTLLLVAVSFPVAAPAGDLDRATAKLAKDPYFIVRTAERFTLGGVGDAGTPSKQETAFRQLLSQPEPLAQCKKLLTEASPAGQLYGLLGLRLLDRRTFEAALPRYKESRTDIVTMNGCIVMHTTTAKLSKQIEEGKLK